MADELEIAIASHPRWLRVLRCAVEEFAREAGFDELSARAITLAVGEAAGNVIKHAYGGRTDRELWVRCSLAAGGVEIEVRDQGQPFEPPEGPLPAPDELRAGGRGLFLMREIMDDIDYCREGDANVLRMRKPLRGAAMRTS
jgi:serine/threonine-protein kinase RsbW